MDLSPIEFMIFNWTDGDRPIHDDDEEPEELGSDEEECKKNKNVVAESYHIYLFGATADGQSVCIDVHDFCPYFYLKIPRNWETVRTSSFISECRKQIRHETNKDKMKTKLINKRDAYGFNHGEVFEFIRMTFMSKRDFNKVRSFIRRTNPSLLYNSNIDPMLVFMHKQDIEASGYVSVIPKSKSSIARVNLCYNVYWRKVTPIHGTSNIPPFKLFSFDIECYASDGFPDPTLRSDYITQIGVSIKNGAESIKVCFVVGPVEPTGGPLGSFKVISFETERKMLIGWFKYIHDENPDCIVGYNINGFDWGYIYARTNLLGVTNYRYCSRLQNTFAEFVENDSGTTILEIPGVNQIDVYHYFRKECNLESYKLDHVAKLYLGEEKRHVSPQEIFKMSGPEGTPESRLIVADYCVQDTYLPLQLMEKRFVLENLIEMSKCTSVPLMWLITRGQQIKVFSQIQRHLRKNGFVFPEKLKECTDDGYQGATVLDSQRGMHMDHPVAGLDFKSLYPSIIRAHNLCMTTLVLDHERYGGLKGVKYVKHGEHTFVVPTNGDGESGVGVIPVILENLGLERDRVKKEMKTTTDTNLKNVLNAKQLAIKVSMNSIYGVFGTRTGPLAINAIASTVTYIGRQMIDKSKRLAEKWYNCTVVYGDTDSIYVKFITTTEGSDKERLEQVGKVAEECALRITKSFGGPIVLEFEKIMFPLLLVGKKRYAYVGHEPSGPNGALVNKGIDVKGLELVKRNYCGFVHKIQNKLLEHLLVERDVNSAKATARKMIGDLLNGKTDMKDLVMSKKLKSKYNEKNKNGQPLTKPSHWHLVQRMTERDPMTAPKSGDLVHFVFVPPQTQKKEKILQQDRIEDPEYIKANGIKPDTLYYLEKQVAEPLNTILSCIITQKDGTLYPLTGNKISNKCKKEIAKLWHNELIKKENQVRKQNMITKYFK